MGRSDTDDDSAGRAGRHRLADGVRTHALFALDPSGRIETWPDSARALYGHDADAVLGRRVDFLFADEGVETLLSAAADGPVTDERRHRRAGGETFPAVLSLSPLSKGYAAVGREATGERRRLDRLREFADSLTHDLLSPLEIVDGRLRLYRETGEEAHLDAIADATDRMERLIEDLLDAARQGAPVTDPEPTDLERVVDTAWEGTGAAVEEATLRYEDVGTVEADTDRLCSLFENLFRNSVEHGSTGSRPEADDSVEHGFTSNRTESGDSEASETPRADGEAVDSVEHGSTGSRPDSEGGVTVRVGPLDDGFYVEDDGPGIPEGSRETVFEHGTTTAAAGNGYGLSIVRTIAEAHGWEVAATEGASGGARFAVTGVTVDP